MATEKSRFEEQLEGLTAEELQMAHEQVEGVRRARSGQSAADAERRKVANMSDQEFQNYKHSLEG